MAKLSVTLAGQEFCVDVPTLTQDFSTITLMVDGQPVEVSVNSEREIEFLMVDGRPFRVDYDRDLRWIKTQHGLHRVDIRDLEAIVTRPVTGDGRVKAPIPGMIASIAVSVGQKVEIGQPLLVLEAMKMQNELRASTSGVVKTIHVQVGQVVSRAQVLAEIEAGS